MIRNCCVLHFATYAQAPIFNEKLRPVVVQGLTDLPNYDVSLEEAISISLTENHNADLDRFVYKRSTRPIFGAQIMAIDRENTRAVAGLGAADEALSRATAEQISRMFAALNATNAAIFGANSTEVMFQTACEALSSDGRSFLAAVFLHDAIESRFYCAAGGPTDLPNPVLLSADPVNSSGKELHETAFHTKTVCISGNINESGCAAIWHSPVATKMRSVAALPIVLRGRSIGVLVVLSKYELDRSEQGVELMHRISENISLRLETFAREDERHAADGQKEDLTRMFAALSATNEAIMRARSRDELFDLVCQAAVNGAKFSSTTIALVEPGSSLLKVVACTGPNADEMKHSKFGILESTPEGRGLTGSAFRSQQPQYSNDFLTDERTQPWRERALRIGVKSAAAMPLLSDGVSVGILMFNSTVPGTFTPDFIGLLQRLAENVSFALANFKRADDKATSDEKSSKLTRMFAALSATNEAIMRAETLDELCERVCAAAVLGGDFTTATIRFADPTSKYLDVAATAGPYADSARSMRLPIDDLHAEQWGAGAIAFRGREPYISNDYLPDERLSFFDDYIRSGVPESGAAWPLFRGHEVIGVLTFMSSATGVFTPDLTELLQRLAENVSFALGNFHRADQKARADDRIEYLATHDALTGLPNRQTFNHLLQLSIDAARSKGRQFAVLFIDLDRFKIINDSLGHQAGDRLLTEIGNRLGQNLRTLDVAARLGGDEFVAILEYSERSQVKAVARSLLTSLGKPIQLGEQECRTTASIGIAMFPADGADVESLTRHADFAMYRAKEDGKNDFRFFAGDIEPQSVTHLASEAATPLQSTSCSETLEETIERAVLLRERIRCAVTSDSRTMLSAGPIPIFPKARLA